MDDKVEESKTNDDPDDGLKRKRENSQRFKKVYEPAKNVKLPQNFRQIPPHLRKHFPDNHVLISIKPDGLCGISCGSTHIFGKPHD